MRSNKATHIRWSLRRDISAILAAEAGNPDAWDESDYLTALRLRPVISMVAEDRYGEPVGIMVYELHRDRVEILRLAVHRTHRRTGIGTALMDKFAYKISSHRRQYGTARVPGWGTGAHLFFRACGWRGVGVRGDDYLFEFRPAAAGGSTTGRVSSYQDGDL